MRNKMDKFIASLASEAKKEIKEYDTELRSLLRESRILTRQGATVRERINPNTPVSTLANILSTSGIRVVKSKHISNLLNIQI